MSQFGTVRKEVVNREVAAIFALLVGSFAIANLRGIPLEPLADLIFSGYWMLRQEFLLGGFLTQVFLTWLWFFIYAYLLAIIIGFVYRRYRR
jgi:hypothetical protein